MNNTILKSFNRDEVIKKVSLEIVDNINTVGSAYDKVCLLSKIKDNLKSSLKNSYPNEFNEVDFEEVFENRENELLEFFDVKTKTRNLKNSYIELMNKKVLSQKEFCTKQYIDSVLVVRYLKHKEKFKKYEKLLELSILEKQIEKNKNYIFFQNLRLLYKIEFINALRSFDAFLNLCKLNDQGFFISKCLMFIFFCLPALLGGVISIIISMILLFFSKINNLLFSLRNSLVAHKETLIWKINSYSFKTDEDKGMIKEVKNTYITQKKINYKIKYSFLHIIFFMLNVCEKINNFILNTNIITLNIVQKITFLSGLIFSRYPIHLMRHIKYKQRQNLLFEDKTVFNKNIKRRYLRKIHKERQQIRKINEYKKNKEILSKQFVFAQITSDIIDDIKTSIEKELYQRKQDIINNHLKFITKISANKIARINKKNNETQIIRFDEILKEKNLKKLANKYVKKEIKITDNKKEISNSKKHKKLNTQKFTDKEGDIFLVLDDFKRQADYADLLKFLHSDKNRTKKVFLIGSTGMRIQKDLNTVSANRKMTYFDSLEQVMKTIKENNLKNDIVVLSPKAAVYDMCKLYKNKTSRLKNLVS